MTSTVLLSTNKTIPNPPGYIIREKQKDFYKMETRQPSTQVDNKVFSLRQLKYYNTISLSD